jgi:putative peptidoglycan lipid II flippase
MLCTLVSRLLGIVKAKVIGSAFGSGSVSDVINFTYNIPNNFRKLFAEGALSSAYVPAFSREIVNEEKTKANKLMNLLLTYQLLLFLILVVLSILFGGDIIDFFSDFSATEVTLGARLLPFFMVFLTFVSLGTVFNGMLQCHKNFFAASFAPLLFSLTVIGGIVVLHPYYGPMSMAYSVVAGGLLQAAFSYLSIRRYGYRLHFTLSMRQSDFPSVVKSWLLVMNSSVIQIIGQQIAYSFASLLAIGSVTAFSNATIFWQTPYGIFFTAISTVYFPLMSQSYTQGNYLLLKRQVSEGLQYLATFMVPSAILLFFLSNECVCSILQGGKFTLEIALLTGSVIRQFAWGMLFVSWYGFLQRFCYSTGRYKLVLSLSALQTALDILLSFILIKLKLGIIALPLANNISFIVVLFLLSLSMKDIYRMYRDSSLSHTLARILLANIPLLLICFAYHKLSTNWYQSGSNLKNFLFTMGLGCIGVLVILISYWVAKIPFLTVLKKSSANS